MTANRIRWSRIESPIDYGKGNPTVKKRQERSVREILRALDDRPGVILADEVGMGKTYVAIGVASAVLAAGGRVQVCVPQGVLHKWTRDFVRCSEWVGDDGNKVRGVLENPILLHRYSDIFWHRSGLDCCGRQACIRCSQWGMLGCHVAPWWHGSKRRPHPLVIWHPGATTFPIVFGKSRTTNWYNLNLMTFLIAIMAASPRGLASQRRWWGNEVGKSGEGQNMAMLASRINQLGRKHLIRLGDEFSAVKGTLEGKDRARQWWSPGSRTYERLRELIEDQDTSLPGKLWLSYAGTPDLLILDEAHKGKSDHSKLQRILDQFTGRSTRVLALTATPFDLESDELGRLFGRITLPDSKRKYTIDSVAEAFAAFREARESFVEQWAISSTRVREEGRTTLSNPLPEVLEKARMALKASKQAYEKKLGPWMIRASKMEEDPYKEFEQILRTSPAGIAKHSAHPYRNYVHNGPDGSDIDVLELDGTVDAPGQDDELESFLLLERLETEVREVIKDLAGLVSRNVRDEVLKTTGADRLMGTKHFMYVGNSFDYLNVREYVDTLKGLDKALRNCPSVMRSPNRAEVALRLNGLLELARRVRQHMLRAERHPKIEKAKELVADICAPVDVNAPEMQGRKVLLFSFNKRPLRILNKELSFHATRELYPYLATLSRKLEMRHTTVSRPYPIWTGLKVRGDIERCLEDWSRGKKPLPDQLLRAAKVPEVLRRRKQWGVEIALHVDKEFKRTGLPTSHESAWRTAAMSLIFAPVNVARWASRLKGRRKPLADDLWRYSWEHGNVGAIMSLVFQNIKAAERSGESGMIDDAVDRGAPRVRNGDTNDVDPEIVRDRLTELSRVTARELAWSHFIDGDTSHDRRWALQLLFNTPGPPYVLLAQSTICKEGIDLHGHCRHLIHYDLEWAPGAMEQREGRIDRVDSAWEQAFEQWKRDRRGVLPKIEVYALRLRGHYDDRRWERLRRRQTDLVSGMGASIIGSMSTGEPDVVDLMDFEDKALLAELLPRFPSFRPVDR